MQASIPPLATSGERPEQLDAITEAAFADVENFEHDLRLRDVSSTEVGQPVRERDLRTCRSGRSAVSNACPSRGIAS